MQIKRLLMSNMEIQFSKELLEEIHSGEILFFPSSTIDRVKALKTYTDRHEMQNQLIGKMNTQGFANLLHNLRQEDKQEIEIADVSCARFSYRLFVDKSFSKILGILKTPTKGLEAQMAILNLHLEDGEPIEAFRFIRGVVKPIR